MTREITERGFGEQLREGFRTLKAKFKTKSAQLANESKRVEYLDGVPIHEFENDSGQKVRKYINRYGQIVGDVL